MWGSPTARAGPRAARASRMRSVTGSCWFSPVRVSDIALSASDALPASIALLFDAESQVSTSGVIASW